MTTAAGIAGKKFSLIRNEKQVASGSILKTSAITSLSQLQQLKLANEASFQNEDIKGFRKYWNQDLRQLNFLLNFSTSMESP